MKVVHIVAAASEKTALLDRLRTLGIVHFAEKASADQRHLERFAELSRMDMALQEYAGPGRETAPMSDKDFEPFIRSWPTAWSAARPCRRRKPPPVRRRRSWPSGATSPRRSCGS
ncbi:MAG: hypothetical protein ACLR5H_02390 [Oscillospiraceae bacterium]